VPTILPLPAPDVEPETGPTGIAAGAPLVRDPVTDFPRLSVLDLVPVRSDQTSADALAAMRELARAADELGFHRYWVAEHHNMPAVAATNPPVLVAMVAAATRRLRVGSGGLMLPNHAPLVVAEQFALLEAAYPGRIDLGLGRAPGTDPVTSFALRHGAGGVTDDAVSRFPDYISDILTMMAPEGAQISVQGHRQVLRATPRAGSVADVWLLGSSHYSAQLAAERGLPYVFAHHFSGSGTAEALELYRSSFRPSEHLDRPRTFLTVNASVADSTDEAHRRALPQLQMMLALRTGQPLGPQALVEEAEKVELPVAQRDLLDKMASRYVIGDPATARQRVAELAAAFDVDEVMVVPVSAAHVGTAPATNPTRVETLRRLAGV
jgi:luciferase family oxidoreductase group 1